MAPNDNNRKNLPVKPDQSKFGDLVEIPGATPLLSAVRRGSTGIVLILVALWLQGDAQIIALVFGGVIGVLQATSWLRKDHEAPHDPGDGGGY